MLHVALGERLALHPSNRIAVLLDERQDHFFDRTPIVRVEVSDTPAIDPWEERRKQARGDQAA